MEHFRPQKKFKPLRNDYANLLWACHACNRAKGDEWPTDADRSEGRRLPNPRQEALSTFIVLEDTEVVPVANNRAAEYLIDTVDLNSDLHRERRRRRKRLVQRVETMKAIVDQQMSSSGGGATDQRLMSELEAISRELSQFDTPPWDAPSSCRCATKERA